MVAEREHLKGKPAPDTYLAGARELDVEPAQAAVFEDALAGVAGRAAPGASAASSASIASGQADALRERTAPTSSSSDLAELLDARVIKQPAFLVEPWARSRDAGSTSSGSRRRSRCSRSRNGHIGLRGNLDEGEPAGMPGSYLNGVLRAPPAALRGGGLREPGGRARRS